MFGSCYTVAQLSKDNVVPIHLETVGGELRESIEVRALVFHEDQAAE
jgi:hypothetical protein